MEQNNLAIKNELTNEDIKKLIYTIRGKQVMLDSDVAMLYHYETKKINQTVKRNIQRFPEKFCFKLTEKELETMWSQIVTTSKLEDNKYRSKKYLPYVFTEQGIAMLSGLLKNKIAIQVSINIMDAFVEMRKFLMLNGQVFERLTSMEYKLLEHDLSTFNASQQLLDKINITNYIPSTDSHYFVTITGETLKLKENIEQFGGKKDQKMATMQCPFHTTILSGLIPIQKNNLKVVLLVLIRMS